MALRGNLGLGKTGALKFDESVFDVDPYLNGCDGFAGALNFSRGAVRWRLHGRILPYPGCGRRYRLRRPAFNLGKEYGENCNDLLPDAEYLTGACDG